LPVPARKVGRLILVSPQTAAGSARKAESAGLYARVSSHDQKPSLDGQVARLSAWAAEAGLPVVRVEAEVGSGVNGSRAKVRRLLADPAVTVVVVEHRDRLGRMNTELVEAALSAHDRRLSGRRSARNRALKALGCAQQDIGPRAVKLQMAGGPW
jgi:putative resolvase